MAGRVPNAGHRAGIVDFRELPGRGIGCRSLRASRQRRIAHGATGTAHDVTGPHRTGEGVRAGRTVNDRGIAFLYPVAYARNSPALLYTPGVAVVHFTLLFLAFACGSRLTAAEKPNVVLIVADDLGWRDLG